MIIIRKTKFSLRTYPNHVREGPSRTVHAMSILERVIGQNDENCSTKIPEIIINEVY